MTAPSVRTVRPTDLVALVTYDGKIYRNEAVTRDHAGTQTSSPHPLEAALEQWLSFATGRHTCISVKGATLRGLISARRRGAKTAWEVDCLLHTEDEAGVLASLFDRLAADAGRAGAEKIFLRLAANSEIVQTASASGFVVYRRERLLAREGPGGVGPPALPPGLSFRRWNRADAHDTFLLYCRATPEPVRAVEAATFREWLASRERISSGRAAQWVVAAEGGLAAWLRTAADGELGRFDLVSEPSAPELLEALIDAPLSRLGEQSALLALIPDFASGLRERLERRGFSERAEFVALARRTTRPVAVQAATPAAQPQTYPA